MATHTLTEEPESLSGEFITGLEVSLVMPTVFWTRLLESYMALPVDRRTALVVYVLYGVGLDRISQGLVEDFENAYVGTYASWQDARDHLTEDLGASARATREQIREPGDDEVAGILSLDEAAVRKRLHKLFVIIELDDNSLYVFHHEPEATA